MQANHYVCQPYWSSKYNFCRQKLYAHAYCFARDHKAAAALIVGRWLPVCVCVCVVNMARFLDREAVIDAVSEDLGSDTDSHSSASSSSESEESDVFLSGGLSVVLRREDSRTLRMGRATKESSRGEGARCM